MRIIGADLLKREVDSPGFFGSKVPEIASPFLGDLSLGQPSGH